MIKIQPFTDQVHIEIEEAKAGVLNTSSRESAVEYAKVVGLGEGCVGGRLKVGDHIFVKAWAIDIISHQDKRYYFVNITTNGILAIVK